MKIELDTNNLSVNDRNLLAHLLGTDLRPGASAPQVTTVIEPEHGTFVVETQPTPPTAEPEPVVAAEAADPTSEEAGDTGSPEPEAQDEDLLAPADPADPPAAGRTMSDAVAIASKLLSSGQAAKVKAALGTVGVKRVSEIPPESIELFLTELGE